jgi:cell division protein FtsW
MTCFSLGVILSVTKKEEEIAQELKEKQIREEALQKLIDAQLESDAQEMEEEYSIEDHANPMNAVLNR